MNDQLLVATVPPKDRSKQFRLFDFRLVDGLEPRALTYAEKSGEIEDRIQMCFDIRAPGGSANTGFTMYLTERQVRQLGEKIIEAADTMRLVQDAQRESAR